MHRIVKRQDQGGVPNPKAGEASSSSAAASSPSQAPSATTTTAAPTSSSGPSLAYDRLKLRVRADVCCASSCDYNNDDPSSHDDDDPGARDHVDRARSASSLCQVSLTEKRDTDDRGTVHDDNDRSSLHHHNDDDRCTDYFFLNFGRHSLNLVNDYASSNHVNDHLDVRAQLDDDHFPSDTCERQLQGIEWTIGRHCGRHRGRCARRRRCAVSPGRLPFQTILLPPR